MNEIERAIKESINLTKITHINVIHASDIYDALSGIDFEDAVENDGSYDVWGEDEGNTWRLNVTLS